MAVPNPTVSTKLFIEPQTGGLSLAYVAYRVGVAVYFLSVLVWSILLTGFDRMLLLYLTNWTFALQTLHIIIQASFVARHYILRLMHRDTTDLDERPLPLLLRIDWVLHNIILSMSLVVSFVYWIVIYDGWSLEVVTVTTHAINSVCVLIDIFITSIPVEMMHMYQPIAYGLTYVSATFVYWLAGGVDPNGFHYIYPILDYSGNPAGSLVVVVVTTIATGLIHCAMCWLSKRRSSYLAGKPLPFDAGKTADDVQEVRYCSSGEDLKTLDVATLTQNTSTQSTETASRVTSSARLVSAARGQIGTLTSSRDARSSSLGIETMSADFSNTSRDAFVASLPDIGRLLLDVATVSSNVKMATVGSPFSEVASLPGIVRAISEYTVAFANESDLAGIG